MLEDEVMGEVQEIDVERIMERIREDIRRRRSVEGSPASDNHVSPFDDGQAAADFSYLHSGYNIQNVSFVSHHRILGPFLVAIKNVLRRLLTPIFERQVAYNIAGTRVTTHLKEWIGTLDRQQTHAVQTVKNQVGILEQSQAQLSDRVLGAQAQLREELGSRLRQEILDAEARLREAFAAQAQEILAAQAPLREEFLAGQSRLGEVISQSGVAARERISRAERKLRRILHALETDQPPHRRAETKTAEAKPAPALPELDPEFDYAGLEERLRGSEEEIKDRQRIYLQYFEGRDNIVDIGCGRGEFLELLRERGIKARGVDLDFDMVLLCREKGLEVIMDDAFAYLGTLADDSVGGIFAAQVIEHLHPQRIIELVKLCHRKIAPDGVLILETPNPKCLMVFADTFYKDPSHVQPAHPDTMQFLFEATGFHDVELKFLSAVDPFMRVPSLHVPGVDVDRFNQGIERLNSLLFGFLDYAVIGRKDWANADQG
jgi:2-polyprenyl-3-methyl-5-hydroxy-6-metoxy-1,4-benzoquinol methylase